MTNGQACGEEAKNQKGLGPRLVGHIIFDGVRDEILDLKEDLQEQNMHD